ALAVEHLLLLRVLVCGGHGPGWSALGVRERRHRLAMQPRAEAGREADGRYPGSDRFRPLDQSPPLTEAAASASWPPPLLTQVCSWKRASMTAPSEPRRAFCAFALFEAFNATFIASMIRSSEPTFVKNSASWW